MNCLSVFLFISINFSGFLHDRSIFLNGLGVAESTPNYLSVSEYVIVGDSKELFSSEDDKKSVFKFQEKSSIITKRFNIFLNSLVSIRDGSFFVEKETEIESFNPLAEEIVQPEEEKKLDEIIVEACNNVSTKRKPDPRLVKAIIGAESDFDPNAISKKGAVGLMQITKGNYQELGINPHDPEENVNAGTQMLSEYLDRYKGNIRLALAAYNAGPAKVKKYKGVPPYQETRKYIKEVLIAYNEYKEEDSFFR